jgi:hypothetical protein
VLTFVALAKLIIGSVNVLLGSLQFLCVILLALTWKAVERRYKTYYRAVFRSYRVLVFDPRPASVAQHHSAGTA